MPRELPSPADIVRSSADTTRRLAASCRTRGESSFAEVLEWRAEMADERGRYLDDIARIRAAPGGLLELRLIAEHEAAVRALEEV